MAMKKKGYRRGGKVKKMMKGGAAGGRKMRMMKKAEPLVVKVSCSRKELHYLRIIK